MFPSTITLTINSVDKILNRVNQDNYGSEYQLNAATESYNLKIRHSVDSIDGDGVQMARHNVFLEHVVYPTATTLMLKDTCTVTIRHNRLGDSSVAVNIQKALNVWLGTGSNLADLGAGVN